MAVIDQNLTWTAVEDRLTTETDPLLRRNLEQLLVHMKAEATGDLDTLMATVADNASYTAFGAPEDNSPRGKAAVRSYYESFIASGATRLQFAIDRLVVDRHCILTEGLMRIAYPGTILTMMGIAVDDPSASYLYEAHMAILWPIDEHGLFTGEDGFAGIADRKLSADDIIELARILNTAWWPVRVAHRPTSGEPVMMLPVLCGGARNGSGGQSMVRRPT